MAPYRVIKLAEGALVISAGPNRIFTTGFDHDDICSDMTYPPNATMLQAKQRELVRCLLLPDIGLY